MRSSLGPALGVTLLALAACDRAPFEPEQASLSTAASEYLLADHPDHVEVVLPYRFVNETGRMLFIPRCNHRAPVSPDLERLHEGEWVPGWETVYACAGVPPAAIPSGSAIEGALVVHGAKAENHRPRFEVPGGAATYRLVLPVFTNGDLAPGNRLLLESRSTEPFTIRSP